jgi:hypothetical protein
MMDLRKIAHFDLIFLRLGFSVNPCLRGETS